MSKDNIYILGIHATVHDSSACVIKNGVVIAAAAEERFTRRKHTGEFPVNAIEFCLQKSNISKLELSSIGISYNPNLVLKNIVIHTFKSFSVGFNFKERLRFFKDEMDIYQSILRTKIKLERIFEKIPIYFVNHHDAHLASTFFASPFQEAGILTIDGYGECSSTVLAEGIGNKIKYIDSIDFPNSIGLIYNAITSYLGFKADCDEGKVMGLASYGSPIYENEMLKLLKLNNSWKFQSNMSLLDHSAQRVSKEFISILGNPRNPNEEITKRHMDIAASLQKVVEEASIILVEKLYQETKRENLCLAGGVALNCVMNGKLIKKSRFKHFFVQPASGDDGTSIGAALHLYYRTNKKRSNYFLENAYLGNEFTNSDIEKVLIRNERIFEFHKDIEKVGAEIIAKGNILGWFQGRMEFGPRALGNRSILADPRKAEMKEIINAKVKFRETFRPYAPVILAEYLNEYFDTNINSPFMTFAFKAYENKAKLIPAVIHVDNTSRVQSVSKKQNLRLWTLISEFKKITNIPVLLNTSFNVMGEPIVNTPEDALNCFDNSGINYLIIGNYLIKY